MTDVPIDVARTAVNERDRWILSGGDLAEYFVRVILDERDRCAKRAAEYIRSSPAYSAEGISFIIKGTTT